MNKAPSRFTMRFTILLLLLVMLVSLALLSGCGGGGGSGPGSNGGDVVVVGKVLDSKQADAGIGGATVTIGGASATTVTTAQATASTPVGYFQIRGGSAGANSATVVVNGVTQNIGFDPATIGGNNGPYTLTYNIGQIRGRVLGTDGNPVSGAFVTIGSTGDFVPTKGDGTFFIDLIAPSTTDVTAVSGTSSFTKSVNIVAGLNDVGDLHLVAATSTAPPGLPNTIVGTVTLSDSPGTNPVGTVVQIYRNGAILETSAVDNAGNYGFYVPVGAYTIKVLRPSYQEGGGAVTVSNPSVPVRLDVALKPVP